MKKRTILAAAAALSLALPSFAARPKTRFSAEQGRPSNPVGGLATAQTESRRNEKEIPPKKGAGKIKRDPKLTVFGSEVPESALIRRSALKGAERAAYDEVFNAVASGAKSAEINSGVKSDSMELVLNSVYYDNPEFFWWTSSATWWNNSSNGRVTKVDFSYIMDTGELDRLKKEFREMSDPIAFYAALFPDDMDKMKYVHDYLCLSVEYDKASVAAGNSGGKLQTAWSAVVDYKTVCTGYSRAFQYYMQQLGIPCAVLTSDSHAWNMVVLDGKAYQIDVTWDDGNLYPKYFNLQPAKMQAISSHSLNDRSKAVLALFPAGDGSMGYQNRFGGMPQGLPYTYRELVNFRKDNANPAEALVYRKKNPQTLSFVRGQKDLHDLVVKAAKSADSTKFSVSFVATDANAAKEALAWYSDKEAVRRALETRWPRCGWSLSCTSSGSEDLSPFVYNFEVKP